MRTSRWQTHPCQERLSREQHRAGSSSDSVALHEDQQSREKGYRRPESRRVRTLRTPTRAPLEALAEKGSAPSASSRGRRAGKKAGLDLFGAPFWNVPAAIVRPRHASIVAKLFERLTAPNFGATPSRQIGSCHAESASSSIRTFPREQALKNLAK